MRAYRIKHTGNLHLSNRYIEIRSVFQSLHQCFIYYYSYYHLFFQYILELFDFSYAITVRLKRRRGAEARITYLNEEGLEGQPGTYSSRG